MRPEQILRHKLFKFYVEEYAFGQYTHWREFETNAHSGITKPIAPTGSLLAANLQTVLSVIKNHYPKLPEIRNVLLFLHTGISARDIPSKAGPDFEVVSVDYTEVAFENFIQLKV